MRTLVLAAITLLVGAMAGMAAANALAKRGAHARAVMVVLARHHDALRATAGEDQCRGEQAARRLAQVDFAAREIDYAFATWIEDAPGFARRSADFQRSARVAAAPVPSCAALAERVAELGRGCQDCHRDFR